MSEPGEYQSWGRYPRLVPRQVTRLVTRHDLPDLSSIPRPMLAYGLGRSYGDSCLNENGSLLLGDGLSQFITFDARQGILRCEAGVSLAEILKVIVPRGWFLPVTPGTKLVTVGGAIANDVHGKNHHVAGTFGCHVRALELLRSSGERLHCSPSENRDLFRATIGGLGLTGLIVWAEIQLKPIVGPELDVERIKLSSLDAFFDLSAASDDAFEYTVTWVDCLARGRALGRGLFMRGNHAKRSSTSLHAARRTSLRVPVEAPGWLLNRHSVRLFNAIYYHRQLFRRTLLRQSLEQYFYPLDGVRRWNLLYGPGGLLQYQCVVPPGDAREVVRSLLERIARSGQASFLAVLKMFGRMASPGLLSFPRPGVTLALDLPFRGARTLALLEELDVIVASSGGALYPAKDARMSPAMFRSSFPELDKFVQYVDCGFSSSFWRRVREGR